MKKILIVMAAIAILVGYSAVATADSTSTTVPLSFTVPAAFGFTLEKYSHDFGTVPPAGGAQTTTGIFCRSNHCVVWKLAVSANAFASGANTLPSSGFTFAAWSNADAEQAKGTFISFPVPPLPGMPVPSAQTTFYTSTLAEGSDPFVPVVLGLYISVPASQASGLYSTSLVLTMFE